MSTPANVYWRHYTASGNEHGVAIISADQPNGSKAIAGGGFAGGTSTSEDTFGNDAQGCAPMVGGYLDYDSGTDTRHFVGVFACPYGATVRVHLWVLVEAEA